MMVKLQSRYTAEISTDQDGKIKEDREARRGDRVFNPIDSQRACFSVFIEPRHLQAKDTVVLADFTNTTGDPVFDATTAARPHFTIGADAVF